MDGKKSFALRYEPELQKKIDVLAEFRSYSGSKNRAIIMAIEIAFEVLKKAQSIKANKEKYDVEKYLKEKYNLDQSTFW